MEAGYVLDYDVISQTNERHLYLMARIQAGRPAALAERTPLNISVVLDRSGSMSGERKLDNVKKASQFLVEHLTRDDIFSLVTYDDDVSINIEATTVVNKDHMNNAIGGIRPGGMTNLSGGWLQGCQLVAENREDGRINRVLLLTDGLANKGVTEPERLGKMARQKRDEGIITTTMGVGMGFNEDLLTLMAEEGGGSFYFIDNADQAGEIFANELSDLLNVVGQNLVIRVTLSHEVKMVRQLNTYPAEVNGNVFTYKLGDLYADELKALLLQLYIPAADRLGEVEIGKLRFDYDELGEDSVKHHTLEIPIIVNAVSDADVETHKPNREVLKTALLLQAARAREEAIKHADHGDYQKATETLTSAAQEIKDSKLDDDELQTQHDQLREDAVDMELGERRYDSMSRKTSSTQAFVASKRTDNLRSSAYIMNLRQRQRTSRDAIERDLDTPQGVSWGKSNTASLVGHDEITIGSDPACTIVLDDPAVSAYHCIIQREGSDLILEDTMSDTGTYANGGRVIFPFRLSTGDVVKVGGTLFMFK